MSSGSTMFPFDFDIAVPFLSTIPWQRRRVTGSPIVTSPRSRITLVKKRQ